MDDEIKEEDMKRTPREEHKEERKRGRVLEEEKKTQEVKEGTGESRETQKSSRRSKTPSRYERIDTQYSASEAKKAKFSELVEAVERKGGSLIEVFNRVQSATEVRGSTILTAMKKEIPHEELKTERQRLITKMDRDNNGLIKYEYLFSVVREHSKHAASYTADNCIEAFKIAVTNSDGIEGLKEQEEEQFTLYEVYSYEY